MAANGGKCLRWLRQVWLDEACGTRSGAALLASMMVAVGLAVWAAGGELANLARGLLARLPF